MSTPEYDELEPEFGEVMGLLRGGLPELPSERPSEAVWDAVAAELSQAEADSYPQGRGQREFRDSTGAPVVGQDEGPGGQAVVRTITSARSWGRPMAILTSVAAALLVGIPLFLASREGDDPLARAELAALDGFDGSGQAEFDGQSLNVRFDGSEAPDGAYYELWLLDVEGQEVEGLQSLGRVEVAADGSFTIPEDVDLTEFDVVDVSIEPDDGNPDHSGASILRGGLTGL